MKKFKKSKTRPNDRSHSVGRVSKKTRKSLKKMIPKKLTKAEKKAEALEISERDFLAKGKKRGFVTYDEILKTFPDIEHNVLFLDELYEKLSATGIDVLEGGNLL
ncbi:MAG TPA: RNA polymerase sigma factor region1.1 domain-containing protein, partial [Candidatus Paceibacterota bacterium]